MRRPFRPALLALAMLAGGCSKDGGGPAPAPNPGAKAEPAGAKAGAPAALAEREKIDRLLAFVESADVVFIRNGAEHGPKAAADHLRTKFSSAGGRVKTARDFIENLASRSSLSGKPYLIRTKDGRETPTRDWLLEALAGIEAGAPAGAR